MERKIYKTLLDWKRKREGRTALQLQGARRIGKTYIVEEFAQREYKSYLIIDFNRTSQQVKDLFLYDIDDLDTFFLKLSTFFQTNPYCL